MNVRIANEVLKGLRGDRSPEARLASRWVQADMAIDYDLMIRLQVLEGAAGVPVDSWWKKPKSVALAKVRAYFGKVSLNPEWLTERSRSLFNVLQRTLNSAIRSFRLNIEPFDVINNSLMGLPLDPSINEIIDRAPYLAGKYLAAKIKKGEETPESVAAGVLTTMLKRKVQNLARHRLDQLSEDDEGKTRDIAPGDTLEGWGAAEETDVAEYLANIFFYDLNDPLGDEIRNFMRQVWSRVPARAEYMNYWLELTEGRKSNSYPDVADHFGINYQSFYQRNWIPAWREFFEALWANRSLMMKINTRLDQKGYQALGDLPRDVINQILPPRRKQASTLRVAHLYYYRNYH